MKFEHKHIYPAVEEGTASSEVKHSDWSAYRKLYQICQHVFLQLDNSLMYPPNHNSFVILIILIITRSIIMNTIIAVVIIVIIIMIIIVLIIIRSNIITMISFSFDRSL